MIILTFLMAIRAVFSMEFIATNPFAIGDQCISVCEDLTLPKLELEKYEQVVCQRGCRFFNILKFKDELNINGTKKECHLSCVESYIQEQEKKVCLIGCDEMAKKRQVEMMNFLILTQDQDTNAIVLAEPDLEILESEMSDPSMKGQIEIGFNIDYKIPETHIRTMPIKLTEAEVVQRETGDWFDCASKTAGIPRWMIWTILSAILVALWLILATKQVEDEFLTDLDVAAVKVVVNNSDEEDKDPILNNCDDIDIQYKEKGEIA